MSENDLPIGTIPFRDRELKVRAPSPEQLLVWQRIVKRLEEANLSDWNGQQVLDAMERSRKIIDTVLQNPADIDWLDDEMLAGRLGLKEASQIILDAAKVLTGNRETRRAAAKTTPARRKAPAKKTTTTKKTTAKKAT